MNVFELFATISLDTSEYDKGLDSAKKRADSSGSKISSGLGKVAKAGAVAVGAAATAVGFLTKSAVSGYAEQEQLVGGVQKLYGNMGMSVQEYAKSVGKSVSEVKGEWKTLESAQNTVLENARNAYKTSGMSMNQYMDTATSFSAALINSLGGDTQKAAEQTDVAMRAISDNFNTFGGDIGSIQYAFQGFAKQNYTMLDNLKLGYGGTKTEMERLIADANEYAAANGKAADLSIDSFSDIVTAIELVQEKQGIAGTTAREAASTISGSFGMLKSAWENLLAGFGDKDANLDKLIKNVISSAETVAKNALPVIEKALISIAYAITEIAPKIGAKIPELISNVLPDLIDAGFQLIQGLITGLVENMPALLEGIGEVIMTVTEAIVSYLPIIANTIMENAPAILEAGKTLLSNLVKGVSQNGPALLSKAAEWVMNLANGFLNALPKLWTAEADMIRNFLAKLKENLPQFIEAAGEWIRTLVKGIVEHLPELLTAALDLLDALGQALFEGAVLLVQAGFEIVNNIVLGIKDAVASALGPAADSIKERIMSAINALKSSLSAAWGAIKGAASSAWNAIKAAVTRPVTALKSTLSSAWSAIKSKASSMWNAIKSAVTKPFETAKEKVQSAVDKIKSLFPISLGKIFKGIINLPWVKVNKKKDGADTSGGSKEISFAKAMTQPYIFDSPTFFKAGEAGDEMLYGRNRLMNDIANAVKGTGGNTVINLNYDASADANDMLRDLARGVRRYKMAGVI